VIVLAAHGSADPRAAKVVRAVARVIGARAAFLDHDGARPAEVLFAAQRAGHRNATVVPFLLTEAYHRRVDLPRMLAGAYADGLALDVAVTEVLGPVDGVVPGELLAALRRRLPAGRWDGLVLAAAGTRDAAARSTVDLVATRLGRALGVPCVAGYASAAAPTPGEAVDHLRMDGARRIALAAYFLAPGRLYESAVRSARQAGAMIVAPPLGNVPEMVSLVRRRIGAASVVPVAA
jgi:sirohydrochlorin ferrochelatase